MRNAETHPVFHQMDRKRHLNISREPVKRFLNPVNLTLISFNNP